MARTRSRKQSYPSGLSNILSTIKDKMIVGRVTDIILDKEHPYFEKYGGWSSIGTIFFEENDLQGSDNLTPAKPFQPQTSSYPLVNEMVLLFSLPNKNIGANTSSETYYYINIISIWNSPHHNAYPNPTKPNIETSAQKDYFQTEAGSPVRKTDLGSQQPDGNSIELNSPTNDFQKTFLERNNISPLLPFPGDIIYEGRWGNSIRLGSTAKPPKSDVVKADFVNNGWSDPTEIGKNGDPITIIKNGQGYNSDNGWECITEDIDLDQSSIYLTSHQKLPLLASNTSLCGGCCGQSTAENWVNNGSIFCSDCNQYQPQINNNSCSATYNQTRNVQLNTNTTNCGGCCGQSTTADWTIIFGSYGC